MVLEVPRQFSVCQTAQSLTCSIMKKRWVTDLNMLLSCFREKMSGANAPPFEYESLNALGSCCTANTAMPLYCAHIERRKASGKRTIGSMARHGSKLGGAGDRFGDYLCLDCANLPSVS